MFLNKERHWITGPFDNKINYDNWEQWADLYIYMSWKYKPLLWNIQGSEESYNLQIIYSVPDGELKLVGIFIHVKPEDETLIRKWLKGQPWLSA